ncbi:hypothetical protein HRW23_06545 [Streptomyces lunaelactis]|uniref:hypothetical protein n=1 Tax=Streptomyces lunaelactis TaxID=1535768 RepID=UPI0015853962|nr:hypothetical protein [Streptomyces lunaelactis]NUJ99920.1 hypothetical protein [Streptomyces lunaelactis]NUK07705.1 hypothetical protein [Streptomyces lunaelactis]NUK16203.1 hypothetical protein [Streptomyces lunaelactis]NUK24594.1 hypothetical protein [Streptomyces lunaelactis]NUK33036.1 hypothetical protein [Streptomyces lunaelactis]
MTTARHLDMIDLLRSREFPAEPGPADVGTAGPGFHIAELNGHFGECADADEGDEGTKAAQRAAEHEALLRVLTKRWGEADVLSLFSTSLRAAADEPIPEPWLRLSATVPDVSLWRIEDRWIAVGASEVQLLVVVTEVDPP